MLLDELARLAQQLDKGGMYRQADALTEIMLRVAQDEMFEEEDEPDPEPGSNLYVPDHSIQPYHNLPQIYTGSDEFLGQMQNADPELYNRWKYHLDEARYNKKNGTQIPPDKLYLSPKYYGDREIYMPKGWSGIRQNGGTPTPENTQNEWGLDNFVFRPQDSAGMEDNVWNTFDKLTGGGRRRTYTQYDNYGSFKPDPDKGRTSPTVYRGEGVYDPNFNQKLFPEYDAYLKGEGARPKALPLMEAKRYQGIGRGDMERLREIDPALYEKIKDLPDFAAQMGHATRSNMSPRNMPFFGRRKRSVDPETGQASRNWYLRPQTVRDRLSTPEDLG